MERILRIRESDRLVYDDIASGKKRLETRAASANYAKLREGDTVTFVCGSDRLSKTIKKAHRWRSIDAMLRLVSYTDIFPHATSVAEVKRIYASYPGYVEKIKANGIIGFELR